MKLSSNSAWDLPAITRFLGATAIPIRIAVNQDAFPVICSLWYAFNTEKNAFICVSHESSHLIELLQKDVHCAFEVAPNEPPYCGVRGQGLATVTREGAGDALQALIDRFLGDGNQSLARWLLGRADEEYLIQLTPIWISSWDYGNRMDRQLRGTTST
jgi:hypothetical protein|tara:strand:- start:377 stop:850 length:474 start_codon:yes stop_codon:yes gene_type:complete